MNNFADLLRAHSMTRNMSAAALAEATKLSPSYISLLLRDKKKAPSARVVLDLATALQLTDRETEELLHAAGYDLTAAPPPFQGLAPLAAGIKAVHQELKPVLRERLRNATHRIWIHDSWLSDLGFYIRELKRLLADRNENERPCPKIIILLQDPNSGISDRRRQDLGYTIAGYIDQQILVAIEEFNIIKEQYPGVDLKVMVFPSLPSVQQIIIDDTVWVGFFVRYERSQAAPQLEIAIEENNLSNLGRFFLEEFNHVLLESTDAQVAAKKFRKDPS